jgi:hypothetical protein
MQKGTSAYCKRFGCGMQKVSWPRTPFLAGPTGCKLCTVLLLSEIWLSKFLTSELMFFIFSSAGLSALLAGLIVLMSPFYYSEVSW